MKIDLGQLEFIEAKLRQMVIGLEEHYGVEFTVTSLYRMNNGESVHGQLPLRGIDLRCRDDEFGIVVEAYINKTWQYDPTRLHKMCCIYHNAGQGAHLHLQVHPNTEKV